MRFSINGAGRCPGRFFGFGGALLSLSLWPALVMAKSASEYFVHSLPGAPEGPLPKMHAG